MSSEGEEFDWDAYLSETNATAAPWECFFQNRIPPENGFTEGMKLEATDPRCPNNQTLATVITTIGPRLKLRLDGTDSMNDFWVMIDFNTIHPVGYAESQGSLLVPSIGFQQEIKHWTRMVNSVKTSDQKAPEELFKPEPPNRPKMNLFSVGMKLEAVDLKKQFLICPATVVAVSWKDITVSFDGWDKKYNQKYRFDSRDIFPVGWCSLANYPLHAPPPSKPSHPSKQSTSSNGKPSTPHLGIQANADSSTASSSAVNTPLASVANQKHSPTPPPPEIIDSRASLMHQSVMNSSLLGVVPEGARARPRAYKSFGVTMPPPDRLKHQMPEVTPENSVVDGKSSSSVGEESKKRAASFDSAEGGSNTKQMKIDSPRVAIGASSSLKKDALVKIEPNATNYFVAVHTGCKLGSLVSASKLLELCADRQVKVIGPASPALVFRDTLQLLVSAAKDDASKRVMIDMCPAGHGPFTVYAELVSDGKTIIRPLHPVSTAQQCSKLLTEFIDKLECCPNILTQDRSYVCGLCAKSSIANGGARALNDRRAEDPSWWTVGEVCEFVVAKDPSLAGLVGLFEKHEIDGKALVLLEKEMMMKYMNLNLGPALKLQNIINELRGKDQEH